MTDIQEQLESKMVTPKDIQRVQFTGKTTYGIGSSGKEESKGIIHRRDWYDANEVDDFLDEYVATTINALGRDAIEKYIEKSKHYIVVDENGNRVFETDSRAAVDSAIDSIKRFKEDLSRDIPDDFLKGTPFDTGDGPVPPTKSI